MTGSMGRETELDRIRFVAAHFHELQGLRVLPVAIALALLPLITGSIVTGTAHLVVVALSPVAVGAAVVGSVRARRHYARRYGVVEARVEFSSRLLLVGLGWLGVLLAVLWLQWSGIEAAVAFSPAWSVFWAAALLWSVSRLRFAPHYAVLAGLGLAVAVAPLGWVPGWEEHPFTAEPYGFLLVAVVGAVAAVLDHRRLARAMSGAVDEETA
jgi:hypothetical protein